MSDQMRAASQIAQVIQADPALQKRLKEDADPLPALEAAAKKSELMGWQRDVWLYRMAISVLGTLALTAAIGSIVLVSLGKTTPESLIALGSASVGALVGLFAPSPNAK